MALYLVDSSVWINHLRRSNEVLSEALSRGLVVTHAFVVGELALGSIKNRAQFIAMLKNLPAAAVADHDEVMAMIEARELFSCGMGWIDAHLLASAMILGDCRLWTADKRLGAVADAMGVRGSLAI